MNAVYASARSLPSGRGPGLHRHLAEYIATRSAQQWTNVRPWPCPTVLGPLAVLGVGSVWGLVIGFALGGGVGAFWLLIGAVFGAPIGAIVGLVVGLPASIVLGVLAIVRDRPATDTERLARHIAGVLAVLIELLATILLVAIATIAATRGKWSNLGYAVVAAGTVVLLSAAAAWLLRFAARDLTRTWARAWGWKAARRPRASLRSLKLEHAAGILSPTCDHSVAQLDV